MSLPFVDRSSSSSLPLQLVCQSKWRPWLKAQSAVRRAWVESLGIAGSPGDVVVLPERDGKASGAVLVIPDAPTLWDFCALSAKLPELAKSGKPVAFICLSGGRSGKACGTATKAGLSVINVKGGMGAWTSAGLPVTR